MSKAVAMLAVMLAPAAIAVMGLAYVWAYISTMLGI